MTFWMTPQQIYEELTGGPGSATLQDAQRISYAEAAAERDRADRIRRLMSTIEGGWQGSAADGAQGAARPLADNAAEGAEYLHRAQDLLDRQAGSFHRAAASVEPMPSPPATEILEQVVPFDIDTEAQTREYQRKAQHNISVFAGYDNASNHNETYLPRQFASANHSGGGVSVTPADTLEVDGSPRGAGPHEPGGRSHDVPSPGPGPQTGPSAFRPPAGGGGVGDPAGSFPLSPAAQQQPGTTPSGGVVGLPGGGGSGHAGTGWPGAGLPGAHGPSGRGGTFGGGPGGAPGAPGGPGGAGRPGVAGGPGSAGGPGGTGRGPGPGPAVGAGALAADEAAARRGAGTATGRGGALGPAMTPLGGGRNKDDDEEHTRKVLIEADPESTFGSDELTAPAVIGDDDYED